MLLSPELEYSLNETDGLNILDLSGFLTITAFDALVTVVHNLTERESLIIDMKDVGFLTSSGINALIEISYYARERGNRVILMSTDAELIDLINFMDCHSHFIFAESFEEAKTKIEYYT
ncbi:MAG: STAS domain-containing protein [Leptospirales bacterium]|nr:STAS domain-containing protein [Leptospirales bacterium]